MWIILFCCKTIFDASIRTFWRVKIIVHTYVPLILDNALLERVRMKISVHARVPLSSPEHAAIIQSQV